MKYTDLNLNSNELLLHFYIEVKPLRIIKRNNNLEVLIQLGIFYFTRTAFIDVIINPRVT